MCKSSFCLTVAAGLCLAILTQGSVFPTSRAQGIEAEPSPSSSSAFTDAQTERREKIDQLLASLRYQRGTVTLQNGLAKLNLPSSFRYLSPGDANKVLHDLWGNPPQTDTLGLIVPSDVELIDPSSWAVVITYSQEGYIKDDEAESIKYDQLLSKMKEASREESKQRVAQGYGPMELIGWATSPHYDKATKKMYWAKEYKTNNPGENSLNYNIRILGRRGVLVLNAIGGISQLGTIEQATPAILSMVDFNQGNRYADFNPKTDKVAAYGIAALVAGGIAMKAGLFKGLLVALLAAKKFVIIGVAAIAAWLKKLFNSGREDRK